jgi:hypothetical protein
MRYTVSYVCSRRSGAGHEKTGAVTCGDDPGFQGGMRYGLAVRKAFRLLGT